LERIKKNLLVLQSSTSSFGREKKPLVAPMFGAELWSIVSQNLSTFPSLATSYGSKHLATSYGCQQLLALSAPKMRLGIDSSPKSQK